MFLQLIGCLQRVFWYKGGLGSDVLKVLLKFFELIVGGGGTKELYEACWSYGGLG